MAAADSGPTSSSDHDPAPGPDATTSSHSSSVPDPSDCPTCSRRTFLKGAGTLAAAAAAPALTSTASAQQSAGVEVINGEYIVEVTDLPNNTLENKIINANGAVVHITAAGDDFTIRNVGIQGPVAKGGNAGVIEPQVESPSGSGIISNCYIDDVGDNCVFINASHAGRLDITNTFFGKSAEDSVYGSPPGNGSQFTQRGKDAGAGGTVHIDKCYSEGAVDYAFRIGSSGSSVTNSTVVDADTALADLYGNPCTFRNVNVARSGIGLKVGDHDDGNMRLLAASGRTTVTAQAIDVRVDASQPVMRNSIQEVSAVLKGQLGYNPDDRIPAGVPTSARAAGRGQSSAAPSRSGRSGGGGAGSQPTVGAGASRYSRAQFRANAAQTVSSGSAGDLQQAIASASPGDIIFVEGGPYTIDRVGISTQNITLAGAKGATIKANGPEDRPLQIEATGVRITGLRFEGPKPNWEGEAGSNDNQSVGIESLAGDAEIDHCEGFYWEAVFFVSRGRTPDRIHHCYIHDNPGASQGYGVQAGPETGQTLIERNYFNRNRHSIAADPGTSGYIARNNVVGPVMFNHAFDQHGPDPAGDTVQIYNNTFLASENNSATMQEGGGNLECIRIRGAPSNEASVHNNIFYTSDREVAVRQSGEIKVGRENKYEGTAANKAPLVNMRIFDNKFGAAQLTMQGYGVVPGPGGSIPRPGQIPTGAGGVGGAGPNTGLIEKALSTAAQAAIGVILMVVGVTIGIAGMLLVVLLIGTWAAAKVKGEFVSGILSRFE